MKINLHKIFPQALDLLGEQFLSVFDNVVTKGSDCFLIPRQVFTHADVHTLLIFTSNIKGLLLLNT